MTSRKVPTLLKLAVKGLCCHLQLIGPRLFAYQSYPRADGTTRRHVRIDLIKQWLGADFYVQSAVSVTLNGVEIPRDLAPPIAKECNWLALLAQHYNKLLSVSSSYYGDAGPWGFRSPVSPEVLLQLREHWVHDNWNMIEWYPWIIEL